MNFIVKERAKKHKGLIWTCTPHRETRCKSNYHQETYYPSHKVNEKYHAHTHTHTQKQNKLLAKCLSQMDWRMQCEMPITVVYVLEKISLQSWTKPVMCGIWFNTTRGRNTQWNLINLSLKIWEEIFLFIHYFWAMM